MSVWDWLDRSKVPLFLTAAAVAVFLLPSAAALELDPSNLSLLENDRARREHGAFVARYGSDDSFVLAIEKENVLTEEVLSWIERFAIAQTGGLPGASPVETIRPEQLWKERRFSARRWRLAVKARPDLTRHFLSPDGRMILVDVRLKRGLTGDERHAAVVRMKQWIASHPPGFPHYLTGSAVEQDGFIEAMQRDHARFTPLTLVLILSLIVVFSGHWAAALFPGAVIAATVVSTYAWMHAAGQKLTPLTLLLAPTLITVSITDAVHLQSHVRHSLALTAPDRLRRIWSELAVPCFFTTVTTAAGFVSLAASPVPAVRAFGVCGTFGILAAYVWTLILAPFFLDAVAAWAPRVHALSLRSWESFSRFTLRLLGRFKYFVLFLIAGSAAWGALNLKRLDPATDVLKFFAEGHPFRVSTESVQRHFGGIFPLEIVAPGSETAKALQKEIKAIPGVRRVLLDPSAGSDHATAFLSSSNSREVMRIAADIRRLAVPESGPILVTGQIYLLGKMSQEMVAGLLKSLAGALALIGLLMGLLLRSPRLGLYCLASNLWPLVITFGLMPVIHVPLSTATATVGCLALGLTVDNAIHLLYRFHDAVRTVPPLGISSLVLAGGFAICLTGSIQATVHFGLLMSFVILLGYFSNLAILTALLNVWPHRSCASC